MGEKFLDALVGLRDTVVAAVQDRHVVHEV